MENANSKLFESELADFEGRDTGIAAFAEAVLESLPETVMGTPEKPSAIAIRTRCAYAFAKGLMEMRFVRTTFQISERDEIKCAILLCDAMRNGPDGKGKVDPDHGAKMGAEIRDQKWNAVLPDFIRDEIAELVESHEEPTRIDGRNYGRNPETPMEEFVHSCVHLASARKTTMDLPGVAECVLMEAAKEGRRSGYLDAIAIARETTDSREWDGNVAFESDGRAFVVLDGQTVPVAKSLVQAFLTVGEARKKEFERIRGDVLDFASFKAKYPKWDETIYGAPGSFFVTNGDSRVPISDVQAKAFGLRF